MHNDDSTRHDTAPKYSTATVNDSPVVATFYKSVGRLQCTAINSHVRHHSELERLRLHAGAYHNVATIPGRRRLKPAHVHGQISTSRVLHRRSAV